jgi:hypothetical protein
MGLFDRCLTVRVALCIVFGIALGQWLPGLFRTDGRMSIAKVQRPARQLTWVTIIPMRLKVDFGAVGQVRRHRRGIGVTLSVNWTLKPLSRALRGGTFIRHDSAPRTTRDAAGGAGRQPGQGRVRAKRIHDRTGCSGTGVESSAAGSLRVLRWCRQQARWSHVLSHGVRTLADAVSLRAVP